MKKSLLGIVLLLCLALLVPVYGWWDEGHEIVNRTAAKHIPKSMPSFFRGAVHRLEYLGPEPDRWKGGGRELSSFESPEHYINMEMLGDMQLPQTRYAYYRAIAAKKTADDAAGAKPAGQQELTAESVGTQPYAAIEVYERLLVAFREYRKLTKEKRSSLAAQQDAVMYAGWLGHYVGDAAQPLHTTVNYNGWVQANPNGYTTDRGTHSKFEGKFVQANLKKLNPGTMVHDPVKLEHPFQDYIAYLKQSNAKVEKLYQLEKTGAFDGDGTPEGVEFVRQQLADGAQMLLNMWYTAWVESAVEPAHWPATPAAASSGVPPKPMTMKR